jgi:hypothetical protein
MGLFDWLFRQRRDAARELANERAQWRVLAERVR